MSFDYLPPATAQCDLCKKTFIHRRSLNLHIRLKHDANYKPSGFETYMYTCSVEECPNKRHFKTIGEYRNHLQNDHHVSDIACETQRSFETFEEAMLWKAELEQRDAAKFIMHNGVYRIKDKSTWRYYCHRNGVYTPKGSGKRQLKIQGSLKTTRSCPAAFVVVGSDSKFHVSYYSKHYGHEHDLGHLTLSPTDREQIAERLVQGDSTDQILEDIRQSVDSNLRRVHLTTGKDVQNIRQSYGIGTSGIQVRHRSNGDKQDMDDISDITAAEVTEDESTFETEAVYGTTTDDDNEVIMHVPADMAKLSLGFAFDMGGSVIKLVYRSKEDYENGTPKDANCPVGKLRLRYLSKYSLAEFVQFIQDNCDTIVATESPSDARVWFQTGLTYASNKTLLESQLNIRSAVLAETSSTFTGLRVFHTTLATTDIYPHPLKISESAVARGRNSVRLMVNMTSSLRAAGEETIGAYSNRPQDGVDLEEYRVNLMGMEISELASQMLVNDFSDPYIFVVLGSATQIYVIEDDQKKSVLLGYVTTSSKSFLNTAMAMTGAQDFNELADMISRGKSSNVDEHTNDLHTGTGDSFYSDMKDELLVFSAGKLGQEKYKGTYSNDDIAASMAMSFCTTTSRIVTLYARQHNAKSVVFAGGFLCQPAMRECLEECFTAESLILPFTGGDVIRMVILPNPGHLGALGVWYHNWELEQQYKQNTNND